MAKVALVNRRARMAGLADITGLTGVGKLLVWLGWPPANIALCGLNVGQNGQGHGGGEYQVRNSWHPPLEMHIWCVYANIFTKQSEPFNSEENSIRGSFAVSEFGERIGKILIVLLGCKIFEVRMPQTTQRFHSVSDSFHSRIDVWVFMMWPLWPSGSGHSGLCPPLPPPSGHKGHIIQPQTSILSWKLSLTSWKCWVVWVILLSNLLQPTRTIRMLPILSRNSSFRQKDPRKISFQTLSYGPFIA